MRHGDAFFISLQTAADTFFRCVFNYAACRICAGRNVCYNGLIYLIVINNFGICFYANRITDMGRARTCQIRRRCNATGARPGRTLRSLIWRIRIRYRFKVERNIVRISFCFCVISTVRSIRARAYHNSAQSGKYCLFHFIPFCWLLES